MQLVKRQTTLGEYQDSQIVLKRAGSLLGSPTPGHLLFNGD